MKRACFRGGRSSRRLPKRQRLSVPPRFSGTDRFASSSGALSEQSIAGRSKGNGTDGIEETRTVMRGNAVLILSFAFRSQRFIYRSTTAQASAPSVPCTDRSTLSWDSA